MDTAEDRERLIIRAQELYKAVLAYAETLPDHYDIASSQPMMWADIRGSNVFIQIDEDILCTAVLNVADYTDRNMAMYVRALEMSAIGLGIAPPRAAEIQWREVREFIWMGDGYSVEQFDGEGWAAYFDSGRIHGRHHRFATLEAAKKACQDHKQGRLEELL